MTTDRREIVITINSGKASTGSNEKKSKDPDKERTTKFNEQVNTVLHPVNSITNELKESGVGGAFVVMAARQIYSNVITPIKNQALYSIQRNFNLNDNYVQEREYNSVKSAVERGISAGKNILSSTATSAMAGASLGGPVGAAIGAAVGFTTSTIGQAVSFHNEVVQNQDQARLKLVTSVMDSNYNSSRAGYALTSSANTYN